MSDADPPRDPAAPTDSAPAPDARIAPLTAELALRDRELAVLREALAAERAQARVARALAEENLRAAEHAAEVRQQLEQAVDENREVYADLRVQCDRRGAELEAALTRAVERAARAEAAYADAEAARRRLEEERDRATALVAEAQRGREDGERGLRVELERVTAELTAARTRAEQERHDAACASAEALTALAAAEYRRRTRYEHTIGELKAAHGAALEQALRADAARASSAALRERAERERDQLAAKATEAQAAVAHTHERLRTLLDEDAARRAEIDALRAQLATRERDVEAAQLAERALLEMIAGADAARAEREAELQSSHARLAALEAHTATTGREHAALRHAAERLAAERDGACRALEAGRAQWRDAAATGAALQEAVATCQAEIEQQRAALAQALRACADADAAAAECEAQRRAAAEAHGRELGAVRAELTEALAAQASADAHLEHVEAARAAAERRATARDAADTARAEELAAAHAAHAQLAGELDAARRSAAAEADRLRTALDDGAAETDGLRAQLAAREHDVDAARRAEQTLHAAVGAARTALAERVIELESARLRIAELEAHGLAADRAHAATRATVEQLTAERDAALPGLAAARAQARASEAAHAALSTTLAARETELAEQRDACAAALRARAEAEAATAQQAEDYRGAADALGRELAALRDAAAAAATTEAELADLRAALAAGDTVAQALQAKVAEVDAERQAREVELQEAAQQAAAQAAGLQALLVERTRGRDEIVAALNAARDELQSAVREREALRGTADTAAAAEAQLAHLRNTLAGREAALEARLAEADADRRAREVELQETARQTAVETAGLRELLDERTRERDQFQATLDTTRAECQSAVSEGTALRAEAEDLRGQLGTLGDIAPLRDRCAQADAARMDAEAERDQLRSALDEQAREHAQLGAQIGRLEQHLLAANESETRLLAELRQRADQGAAAEVELQRLGAARDRLLEEHALTRQALAECRAATERIEGRASAAETVAQATSAQCAEVQKQARCWREQLDEGQRRLAALDADLERARGDRTALQSALDELQAQRERERAEASDAAGRAAAVAAERDQLEAQVAALTAEREALRGECDELGFQGADGERLRARIMELERQQNEPPRPVVTLEALTSRAMADQLRALEQARANVVERLPIPRRDRERPERRFGVSQPELGPAAGDPAAKVDAPADLAVGDGRTAQRKPPRVERAGRAVEAPLDDAPTPAIVLGPGEELTVVHIEDHAPWRDVVRAAVERCTCARYAALHDISPGEEGSTHLLAVNLLARDTDPLSAICDPRWRLREPRAFTYLAAGARGIVAGLTDFMPYPLDPNDCVTRLLERPGSKQRLLMVSDKIEVMNEIRTVLNRVDCSTSLALDGRQGFTLAGMVKPDVILIDLTLPRGDGLRLVARLRSDPKTAGIAIIFALAEPLDAARFHAEAARVLGDCRFSEADLSEALDQMLGDLQRTEDQLETA